MPMNALRMIETQFCWPSQSWRGHPCHLHWQILPATQGLQLCSQRCYAKTSESKLIRYQRWLTPAFRSLSKCHAVLTFWLVPTKPALNMCMWVLHSIPRLTLKGHQRLNTCSTWKVTFQSFQLVTEDGRDKLKLALLFFHDERTHMEKTCRGKAPQTHAWLASMVTNWQSAIT